MPDDRILLVEGNADRLFFEQICETIGVKSKVHVAIPTNFVGRHNSKQAVMQALHILIKQLNDGSVKSVSLIVDADYEEYDGLGFEATLRQIALLLNEYGFAKRRRVGQGGGFLFEHDDGLAPIGAWIMPNDADDGMKEDWALAAAVDEEADAVEYARNVLKRVPGAVKYKSIHLEKAIAAVWMSWQANPGQGLHQAVRNELVDLSNVPGSALQDWLKEAFP